MCICVLSWSVSVSLRQDKGTKKFARLAMKRQICWPYEPGYCKKDAPMWAWKVLECIGWHSIGVWRASSKWWWPMRSISKRSQAAKCDVRLHRIIAPESVKTLKEPAVPPAVLLGGEAGR